MPSKLILTMASFYKYYESDVKDLTDTVAKLKRDEWQRAIQEETTRLGYGKFLKPDMGEAKGADADNIDDETFKEMEGFSDTWNKDVLRQLEKLYKKNPRGNRNYYIKHMEEWAKERQQHKLQSVMLNSSQKARNDAKIKFAEKNGLTQKFLFVGPVAVCKICIGHFSQGLVDLDYVKSNPSPVHLNCPHEWEQQITSGSISPEKVWTSDGEKLVVLAKEPESKAKEQ